MKNYEMEKLDEFREIEVFSVFFITFYCGSLQFCNKFFGRKKIKQQKIREKQRLFDEWNCGFYWTDWKTNWINI